MKDDADMKSIKKAYYSMAHKYHPDKAGDKHVEKFKQISAAWEVIGDADQRKQYDTAKVRGDRTPFSSPYSES